jgi:hopanoid C-3 methylase
MAALIALAREPNIGLSIGVHGAVAEFAGQLLRGQTNFVKSLFKLNSVYRPDLLLADHQVPVAYEVPKPTRAPADELARTALYIHAPRGRKGRAIDAATERFVEETRIGSTP